MPENKYKYWVVTIQQASKKKHGKYNYLPIPEKVIRAFDILTDKYVFQIETAPTSGAAHYQCVISTKIRKRHSTLLKELAQELGYENTNGIHLDRMRGEWETAVAYCTKEDTRREGTYPFFSVGMLEPYKGSDVQFMSERDRRYPWQNSILDILFKDIPLYLQPSDGRTVIWITDEKGATGKSLLVKYICYNNKDVAKISFGSAGQLRSAIIGAGPKKLYFIDIPRTLGTDDSLNNILTCIEDTVNGFVVSNYYGQYKSMIFDPPHIVVFSNMVCPYDKLSSDRWKVFYIIERNLHIMGQDGILRRCDL